ncbi:P-loop containing nucleoside triphosphate hydrolase protein [Nemania serpens]|nr:P-loop containing nucleoside triphosphate hydrolase protein [Nemania serpens]
MRGGLKLADRGVIPRLLSGVFRRAKKITKDSSGKTTVTVALSYYEIYNDKVFDLLEPVEKRTPSGLPLRAEANGKTVVAGLSERPCEDLKDFEKLYIEANTNRVTAATKLNAHSSRSHAILRVKVTQTTGDMVRESTASAIDLAGSEDNRRTDNGKERLVESAAINKSLFVLSQCIDAIARGERRIPFRESKMTRILSLGQNNGITIMILNLAPLRSYHLDTLSSLNVSSRAKRIEVREIENEIVYKQPPRSITNAGPNITRQPLRPLANAHNIGAGVAAAAAATKPADRPIKAFSVYTDKAKPAPTSRPANTAVKRSPKPDNRPSDSEGGNRPSKITRPELVRPTPVSRQLKPSQPSISADQIEAMVEKKVSEILAARTQSALPPPDPLSDDMRRRLEALERRIDDGRHDDTRSEGLRFLLMARQHKERGENTSALKMYEMALPYFPGQAKLLGKIEKLKACIAADRMQPMTDALESPAGKKTKKTGRWSRADDDGYNGAEADDDSDDGYESYVAKSKKRGTKPKAAKMDLSSVIETGPISDALLHIINSKDVSMIMGLQGLGPKKARDLVQYLDTQSEDGGHVETLVQLRAIPGMGGRTVDRAYEGLVAGGVC